MSPTDFASRCYERGYHPPQIARRDDWLHMDPSELEDALAWLGGARVRRIRAWWYQRQGLVDAPFSRSSRGSWPWSIIRRRYESGARRLV